MVLGNAEATHCAVLWLDRLFLRFCGHGLDVPESDGETTGVQSSGGAPGNASLRSLALPCAGTGVMTACEGRPSGTDVARAKPRRMCCCTIQSDALGRRSNREVKQLLRLDSLAATRAKPRASGARCE